MKRQLFLTTTLKQRLCINVDHIAAIIEAGENECRIFTVGDSEGFGVISDYGSIIRKIDQLMGMET